ncbi:uncharacterized protein EI97DRAFT_462068 [Westerdykella ornata]|uniref:Uncharacterized protein n=1 Tax=Westerdykella ornata TaxID=318751 RepID=A0A6A6J6T3_WESOR|nr:uncharacterized protein EI97DRAFT_462068 [Westerdykella ornata]KAF2272281.1 hypothetical protein EI97DRAFT_462068 [Westerdykella ornata]
MGLGDVQLSSALAASARTRSLAGHTTLETFRNEMQRRDLDDELAEAHHRRRVRIMRKQNPWLELASSTRYPGPQEHLQHGGSILYKSSQHKRHSSSANSVFPAYFDNDRAPALTWLVSSPWPGSSAKLRPFGTYGTFATVRLIPSGQLQ